jgi:hypothetical protein
MASQPASPAAPTCQFKKSNGEFCKRSVDHGEHLCWQHAPTLRKRWRSLTRNQSLAFIFTIVGLVIALAIGLPSLWFGYVGWQKARNTTPPPPTATDIAKETAKLTAQRATLSVADNDSIEINIGTDKPKGKLIVKVAVRNTTSETATSVWARFVPVVAAKATDVMVNKAISEKLFAVFLMDFDQERAQFLLEPRTPIGPFDEKTFWGQGEITEDERKDLEKHTAVVYVMGKITYNDRTGALKTEICRILFPPDNVNGHHEPTASVDCPSGHNDIAVPDDGK